MGFHSITLSTYWTLSIRGVGSLYFVYTYSFQAQMGCLQIFAKIMQKKETANLHGHIVIMYRTSTHCPKNKPNHQYIKTESVIAGANGTICPLFGHMYCTYLWPRKQTSCIYTVVSACNRDSFCFNAEIRLFLGQCKFNQKVASFNFYC